MRIGILGSGTMGSALAFRLRQAGHAVLLGSRSPTARSTPRGELLGTYAEAAGHGEVLFLALPWPHGPSALRRLDSLAGKAIVDVSNPETPDGRGLALGHTTSGAEILAAAVPGIRVVKAFSHFYAELLHEPARFEGGIPSVFFCGDDAGAKALTEQIILSCGLDPIDAGPLANARYLEPLAMLTVQLVRAPGFGPTGIAWKLMRRAQSVP